MRAMMCNRSKKLVLLRPDKVYDVVMQSKLCQVGDLTAWAGKLSVGDSRAAYVTRDGVEVERNGKTVIRDRVPVASFWSEEEAIKYVRENG